MLLKIKYHQIVVMQEDVAEHIQSCLQYVNYFDLALLLHVLYKDTFVVTNIHKKTWFTFDHNIWTETEIGPYYELSTVVLQLFKNELITLSDKKTKKNLQSIRNCEKIIGILGDPVGKETICKECLYVFYDKNFIKQLDTDPNLIPFVNGVLNLKSNEFRLGLASDRLSVYINNAYRPSSKKKTDKLIKDFVNFREQHIRNRLSNYNEVFYKF